MKIAILAALAALTAATPALAQDNSNFTGVRAEVNAGYNDITHSPDLNDVVYGAEVGLDAPVGDKAILGVEGNTANIFEHQRQIGVAARMGYAVTPNILPYVKVGYDNYRDAFEHKLDGVSVGGGVEYSITPHTYVKAEYKYSDFEDHTGSHAALAGVGVRF